MLRALGYLYLVCMLAVVLWALGTATIGFARRHLRRWFAPLERSRRLWDRDSVVTRPPTFRSRPLPPYIIRRRDGAWVGVVRGADDAERAQRLIELCK